MEWLLRFGDLALPDAKTRDNAWASQIIVTLLALLTVLKLYQMARPGQLPAAA